MTVRILHVHPGNMIGGAERVIGNIAQHDVPGFENHFALFEGPVMDAIEGHAPVYTLPVARFRNPLSVMQTRTALRRLLGDGDFDLVLTHAIWTQALFGAALRSTDKPLVFWLRGRVNGTHWTERAARRTVPTGAICNSEFSAGTLDRLYSGLSGFVLYNPLHPHPPSRDRWQVRAEFGVREDQVVVAMVSRIEQGKGHEHLIRAMTELPESTVCWIVGGPQREHERRLFDDLQRTASDLGVSQRISFLGQRKDVSELYNAADLFCQPNVLPEGFGNTFVEALYAGLPVVTTAMGGALEIVNDSCGRLTEPNDSASLVNALRDLIENSERRTALGAAGPARARSLCDPDRQFAKLYTHLRTFLNSE